MKAKGVNLDAAELERKIEELNEKLRKKPDKQQAKALKIMEKEYLPRLRRYEEQEAILGDRNSYSKTDPDATFMRTKEDHLKNGQLKPANGDTTKTMAYDRTAVEASRSRRTRNSLTLNPSRLT